MYWTNLAGESSHAYSENRVGLVSTAVPFWGMAIMAFGMELKDWGKTTERLKGLTSDRRYVFFVLR